MYECCVCTRNTGKISIIQEIGNIKRYIVDIFCTMIVSPIEVTKNTVLMKDAN